MDRQSEQSIMNTLSGYIAQRDNFRTSATLSSGGGDLNKMVRFNDIINRAHATLFDDLPNMNMAELEAFAELANSRLNYLRMHMTKKG